MRCRLGWHRYRFARRFTEDGPASLSYGDVCERCGRRRGNWPDVGARWYGPPFYYAPEMTPLPEESP